jgi:hypothetical protein
MARLVEWARAEGIPHLASADDHELTDAEISDAPDFRSTYPPHCLRGTRGAEKIAETAQADPVPLALTDVPAKWLRGREYLLLKKHFADWASPDMNVTVLVDFENDSVRTALEVARALGPRLWGVRLDTSESLVDRSLVDELGDFRPTGVNERLVQKVREALDGEGFEDVRIVVSGGFTVDKIEAFERAGVPVDAYGVGSSLIRGSNDFTADIVMTDGKPSAKLGRRYRPSLRLERVT